jgi:hypothetical protein
MLRQGFSNFSFVHALRASIIGGSLILAACAVPEERAAGSAGGTGQASNTGAGDMAQTSDQQKEISADIERLSKQIALPVRPVEVLWRQEVLGKQNSTVPGPRDYRLVAVLKYDEKDVRALIEKVGGESKETDVGNVDVEAWFPEAVKKFAQKNDDGMILEGATYTADSFLRAPYSSGKLVRAGQTNYFVLNIFSL